MRLITVFTSEERRHTMQVGVSIGVHGRRIPGPIVLLSVLYGRVLMAVTHQWVQFANIVVVQFQFRLSVANAETSTSEGKVSRDRAVCSLFDRAAGTQPARATARRFMGSISKVKRGSELCGYEGFGLGESGRNARSI
jgi:hypothetical protein